jgi:restriction endonuclease S subunit
MHSLIGPVPDAWRHARLADVCDILSGPSGTRLRLERRTSANIPVITPQSLRNNRIADDGDSAVPVEQAASLSRYQVRSMDVVVARTGVLGRQGLASEDQDGWLLGSGCLRLRPVHPLEPRYLSYYLCHPSVRDWVISNGAASAISTLTTKTLGALPVAIPPTETQTVIAEMLGALDEKVAIHEQIVETTVALRDAITPLLFAHISDIEHARR